MTWKVIGDIAFYACTVAAALFVLLYLVLAPWWRTETGRNIMAVMASMALCLCYFAFAIGYGGVPAGFYPTRALLFGFVFLSVAWRIAILLRVQLASRMRRDKK